jgi:pimeloyl-ACP methyl ester carboxylesterase
LQLTCVLIPFEMTRRLLHLSAEHAIGAIHRHRRWLLALSLDVDIGLDAGTNEENVKSVQDYAPVNGLQMYYEVHGVANRAIRPLVLLHGGGDTIETTFGHILPEMAENRQVIAFERQGYGHTADLPDRPFSFEQMADDTAALLNYLQIAKADLFGFSSGGTVALYMAVRHAHLVRKLVIASTFFSREGGDPAFWSFFERAQLSDVPRYLQDAYLAVAPQPENLEMFFRKARELMRHFEDIPENVIRRIKSPTLVIAGDSDIVSPEHATKTFRLLEGSRLAILPGTTHESIMSRTSWLVSMVNEFLDTLT